MLARLAPGERPDSDKYCHAEVWYEHPSKHIDESCGHCVHYIRGHVPRCQAVTGPIRPQDWCQRFED